jgi:hypothetical protein
MEREDGKGEQRNRGSGGNKGTEGTEGMDRMEGRRVVGGKKGRSLKTKSIVARGGEEQHNLKEVESKGLGRQERKIFSNFISHSFNNLPEI